MDTINQNSNTIDNQIKDWFDNIVATLRKDEVLYETGMLDQEAKEIYDAFLSGNEPDIAYMAHSQAKMYFLKNMFFAYLSELKRRNAIPLKLAFDISKSKLLVWAEIEDDNERMEDELILAEAKVHYKYYPYGYSISSTIVEKSDNLQIPPHYETIQQ
jgi:hypothetical protein